MAIAVLARDLGIFYIFCAMRFTPFLYKKRNFSLHSFAAQPHRPGVASIHILLIYSSSNGLFIFFKFFCVTLA
jgi:hypothetical protein